MGHQLNECGTFTGGGRFEQFNQIRRLLCGQWEGRDTKGCAFGNVLAIGFKHDGAFQRLKI
jgi:hypothetical protein